MDRDTENHSADRGSRRFPRWLRQTTRAVALAVAVVLLLRPAGAAAWSWPLPAAISPLVGLASSIALRSVGLMALIGLPVLLLSVLSRRWFCRYACPTGLLTDAAGRACPWRRQSRRLRLPSLGDWILVAILTGALAGYPVLLWMDPLALLTAAITNLREFPLAPTAMFCAAGLPAVLLLSLVLPGAWCTRICPLGTLQDLAAVPARFLRRRRGDASQEDLWSVTRRRVFAAGLGGLGALLAVRSLRAAPPLLRPPGAEPEDRFTGLCVRCGNCARACPAEIVYPDLGESGVAGLLAPRVRFTGDYCREDCRRCAEVCPSGALQRPTAGSVKPAMGLARANMEICLLGEDRECSACRSHCPYEAIRYQWSDATYAMTVQVDAEKCPGCGACQVVCPTSPDKAIIVVPLLARTPRVQFEVGG